MLFTTCMNYRKELIKDQPARERDYPINAHLTDLVHMTLCPKLEAAEFHQKRRRDRECRDCGVDLFRLLPEEAWSRQALK